MPRDRVVIAQYEAAVRGLGLDSIEGVLRYRANAIDDHADLRSIHRIEISDEEGRPVVLFLKRIGRVKRKDGLKSLLHHGAVWSAARQEWENSRALNAAGIRTAGLVAYGERFGWAFERFSFIITLRAEGDRTLDEFLADCTDGALRRRVIDDLAVLVGRMHEAGLAAADLFGRHIFLGFEAGRPQFCLIDMYRLDRGRVGQRLRARDLAALNASIPLAHASAAERVRFLRAYAGSIPRALVRQIERRMRRLLAKPRFRSFLEARPAPAAGRAG